MYRGNSTRVFPIILVIIVIALVVTAIVSAIQAMMGSNTNNQPVVDASESALLSTADTAKVRMTVRGALVADENFRSYQISVSPDNRTLTTYMGYLDQVLETKQLSNNVKAYDEFVHALHKANFLKSVALSEEKNDIRGICATGRVYEFDIISGGDIVKHLWTSTCKGSPGSSRASTQQLQNLFMAQIPDARDTLKKISL